MPALSLVSLAARATASTALVVVLGAGCASVAPIVPSVRVTGRWIARRETSGTRDARSTGAEAAVVLVWSRLPAGVDVATQGALPIPDAAATDCASDPLCAWTMAEACDAYARLEGADPRCPVPPSP